MWGLAQTVVEDGCTSSDCFKGSNADLFTALQPLLNFTFVVTRNVVAGRRLENGSWNGQIGKNNNNIQCITLFLHSDVNT